MFSISDFMVEYQACPLGLDELKPRFSWKLISDKNSVKQSNYKIIVKTCENKIMWDTEIVEADSSIHIEYNGKQLKPRKKYFVELVINNNYGDKAESHTQFETSLLTESISGSFITADSDIKSCPKFVKKINLSSEVKSARIYATALGVYEIFINKKRVGDMYDAPFWTSYNNRLQYQTYDVTSLLVKGENLIEAIVANGWYKGELGFTKTPNNYGDKTAFCMDMFVLDCEDRELVFSTDLSWQCTQSQLLCAEFFDGEVFDSTLNASKFFAVKQLEYNKSKIVGQISEPVRVTEKVAAKKLIATPQSETVIDFGQNLTGIVEFSYKGDKGDIVTIEHAEVLDKHGNFYTANLRQAKCIDTYTLSGENQVLKPHFTFHGFRYIKLVGFNNKIDIANFTALVLGSDMHKTGSFSCNDKNINQLQSNIVWGQRGNFFDVPTDCPQRDERLGWTGDAQVFCSTAAYNYNVALFFSKWLGDLKAEQTLEKGVPQIIPNILGNQDAAACWGDAATIIPFTMYNIYGDKRLLANQYQSMKDWVEYISLKAKNNLWQSGFQYGDWLALDKEESSDRTGATDKYFVATAFYAYSTQLLYKAAEVLNFISDYKYYKQLYNDIVSAFQHEYVTASGRLVSETQTACVLALHFNLIQNKFRDRVMSVLKDNLSAHKNHLATGFAGTSYLNFALTDNGMHDISSALLLNEDYPSWIYQVKKGATTIWERWNGILPNGDFFDAGMNSFNHYAYGSIGDFLYRRVAGIEHLEAGYKKILIKPYLTKGLKQVTASFESMYGEVSVSYLCENKNITFKIKVPPNTTAVLQLPQREICEVGSGAHEISYGIDIDLTNLKFSFDTTLNSIFSNDVAVEYFKIHFPTFFDNPMIEFAKNMTINEMSVAGGEAVKQMFSPIIDILNKLN